MSRVASVALWQLYDCPNGWQWSNPGWYVVPMAGSEATLDDMLSQWLAVKQPWMICCPNGWQWSNPGWYVVPMAGSEATLDDMLSQWLAVKQPWMICCPNGWQWSNPGWYVVPMAGSEATLDDMLSQWLAVKQPWMIWINLWPWTWPLWGSLNYCRLWKHACFFWNLYPCISAAVWYSLSKFGWMHLCVINYDHVSPCCCKYNSFGFIEAMKYGNVCQGPH